jgi:hypothetical protein
MALLPLAEHDVHARCSGSTDTPVLVLKSGKLALAETVSSATTSAGPSASDVEELLQDSSKFDIEIA